MKSKPKSCDENISDSNEHIYENVVKQQTKDKPSFENFPWKFKIRQRSKGEKTYRRSRSASNFDHALRGVDEEFDASSRGVLPAQYSADDSCTVGYHLAHSTSSGCGEGDNSATTCGNELDACENVLHENDAERRSRMFGTPIPADFLVSSRIETHDNKTPTVEIHNAREGSEIRDSGEALYANFTDITGETRKIDCESHCDERGSTHSDQSDNSTLTDKHKKSNVAVCEVKPTVREAADFKKERNKAIRRASSAAKKTVTFKLDKPEEFIDPPSTHPFRKIENIVIAPTPENGIIKNKDNSFQEKELLAQDDEQVPRSSQLSPNGTSSDSGRDSFMSCCSQCNCSSPSHFECERPQCQAVNVFKEEENTNKISYDRVEYTAAFIASKLEDSIYLSKRRKSQTPRRLEPGVTSKSAEYLNFDVAQAILLESRQNQFATYKSTEQIYASIKEVNDVPSKKEPPPQLPPRDPLSTQNRLDTPDGASKSDSLRRARHSRPSKNDLLLMNKFHSYTLGDVMDNYTSLLEDISQDGGILKTRSRKATSLPHPTDTLKTEKSSEHHTSKQEPILLHKQSNIDCLPTHTPQKTIALPNPTKDDSKIQNTCVKRTEFGAKQKHFLADHKTRSQSESALLTRMSLSLHKPNQDQLFGQRKSLAGYQMSQNQCIVISSEGVEKVGSSNYPSESLPHNKAKPPEAEQRGRGYLTRFNDEKRQAYSNRSKSWSCVPEGLRGSPIQITGAPYAPPNPASAKPRLVHSQSRTPSPHLIRQFPDVRWVVKPKPLRNYPMSNGTLSKTVSRSEPLIKWTQSEMAEIFC